jgi:hypothetical protein
MGELVLYETVGHLVTITYNRPEARNAINGQMRDAINRAFTRFREDEDAWVAIVTGAGPSFCAGADMADPHAAAGTFPGTFWERPTVNSFESPPPGRPAPGRGSAGRPGHQGDGGAGTSPAPDRSDPFRGDHAQGGGGHGGRGRGDCRLPGEAPAGLAGPLTPQNIWW